MKMISSPMSRRAVIRGALGVLAASIALSRSSNLFAATVTPIKKAIPSSGELIPIIGMGTSRTFNKHDKHTMHALLKVLEAFFEQGGTVIDSSPMYGVAELVLGKLLKEFKIRPSVFSATKVWIDGKQAGIQQMRKSMALWGVRSFDLIQVHNLHDWKIHLQTLKEWKQQGKLRYIGITTSHNKLHDELSSIMKQEPLDFVQFSYNIGNRTSESTLLSIAADRGIATLINRPFQRGDLFRRVQGKALPDWAAEFNCNSWAQFFLKFVVSHPAVTCAIPATSKVKHALDNMQAGFGNLPDTKMRKKMIDYFEKL